MNIVNLVGKLSFDTDLKGAEKFLAISKKCNEEAKQLQKSLKKAGEDAQYQKLSEDAKKLKENLKGIKESLFTSDRTNMLSGRLRNLQEQKRLENLTYRENRLEAQNHPKWSKETRKRKLGSLKAKHDARILSYDKEIKNVAEKLASSKAEDRQAYEAVLGENIASSKKADKAVVERKKQISEENALTKEKIENLKEESAKNKDFAKDKQKAGKNSLLALGKFTASLGVAVAVFKGLQTIYEKTVSATSAYAGAEAGGDIPTEGLQQMATFLRASGFTTNKKDLTKLLGSINAKANLRDIGQNFRADMPMAGINPQNARQVSGFIRQAYASYLRGENRSVLMQSIRNEGFDDQLWTAFRVWESQGKKPKDLFPENRLPSATGKANVANTRFFGGVNKAVDYATGALGKAWQEGRSVLSPFLWSKNPVVDSLSTQGGNSTGSNNISINKNITVNTNNGEAVKEAINDEAKDFKIMPMMSGGEN